MSAIRIDTLPVLENLEDRDLVNFQRLVDGVWTDYHTDAATLQGAIRTYIQFIDLRDTSGVTIITPAADELVVPIALWVVYTPDETPNGQQNSVQLFNGGGGPGLLAAQVIANATASVFNATDVGEMADLDQDLNLSWITSGANGTAVIFAQYAILPKI